MLVSFDPLELIVKQLVNFSVCMAKNKFKDNRKIISKISPNGYLLNTYSQFPLSNGVFDFSLDENKLKNQLEESIKMFEELKQPFAWWWLKNTAIPEKVSEELTNNGFFSAGDYAGIICDLADIRFSKNPSDQIRVRQVSSQEDYDIFSNIIAETLQLPEMIANEFKLSMNPTVENSHRFSHFLGYYQNEPVSSLTVYKENDTVGLYAGTTLPKARNRGVATAAIEYALRIAIEQGYQQVIAQLMAKNMAAGICQRLGFKTVCHFTPYIYGANANNLEG